MKKNKSGKMIFVLGFCLLVLLGGSSAGMAADQYTINCIAGFAKIHPGDDFFHQRLHGVGAEGGGPEVPGSVEDCVQGRPGAGRRSMSRLSPLKRA